MSIWAVPERTIKNFVNTFIIAVLAVVIYVIAKLWSKFNIKRSFSKRELIIYVILFIGLTLLFGTWGFLASIILVMLNEVRRTVFA